MLGRDGGLGIYDGDVTALRRRADPLVPVLAAALALLLAACGPAAGSASPPVMAPSSAASGPSLTPVPGGPASPAVRVTFGPPTTTDINGFGKIFDRVPASFPRLPDQTESEIGSTTSGMFVSNLDAGAASRTIRDALTTQGWSVDVSTPLEDGTVVLVATGPQPACKAEVRFTPASGSILMSVLYGASCPST